MTDLSARPDSGSQGPPTGRTLGLHLRWLAGGLAAGFAVPYVLADLLEVHRDLFYGMHALAVVMLFVGWARSTGQSIAAMARRRWRLMLLLSAIITAILSVIVVSTEDTTPRPDGIEFVGAVLWRGLVYGAVDGMLLSAFPILVVFAAAAGTQLRQTRHGTIAVGALALLASLVMTATYHLGYSDFRSVKLARPLSGDLVWSIPTLVTLNPVGAAITHAGLHVTAVLHSYDTDIYLPPHR